jgi:hypothetical protein
MDIPVQSVLGNRACECKAAWQHFDIDKHYLLPEMYRVFGHIHAALQLSHQPVCELIGFHVLNHEVALGLAFLINQWWYFVNFL